MNLSEIFAEVALLINHDLTNDQLTQKLNQVSLQLFREFPVPDKTYRFTTTYVPYYALPADCAEDRIRCVSIDGVDYVKMTPEIQTTEGPYCTVLMGSLYLKPNPVGRDAYLYYGPRHVTLSSNDLTAVPGFPSDYHELLVFALAKYAAISQRDVELANNFQAEYDDLEKRAMKGLKKMGLKRVNETTKW